MSRWLLMIVLAVGLFGCDRFQTARTPTPTSAPASLPAATEQPSPTPLPPTATPAPTDTSVPTSASAATGTETATGTPSATGTNTPVRLRPTAKATATNTAVALEYSAPVLIEPNSKSGAIIAGQGDMVFKWNPAGDLGENECYLIEVLLINLADPLQRYVPFSSITGCHSVTQTGVMSFVLYTKRHGQPNYDGMVSQSQTQFGPTSEFDVRWWVTVVLTDRTPLSPPSERFDFTLQSP
jgi:cytoskeletal protein RodZ